jgi:hypothetical protein
MATFVWPKEVQWPPPANILLNYDVVAPGGVLLSSLRDRRGETEEESMTQPYLALITPLAGGLPDQGLPGGGHPWAPGAIGRPGVGGGPVYAGHPSGQPLPPGGPADPGWGGGWGGGATDPGWGQGGGEHPGNRPPGGEYPSGGPIYGGGHPSGGPIVPPQGGTPVPEDEYTPAPPPENIYSQYIVSVWDPKTASWTTKTYPPR